VLKLGKFVAAEPREILLAEQSIQDRVAQDLADPYSKVSLWLQHFPHLAGSVARYRALQRYKPEELRYAFQEGYVLGGTVVKNARELERHLRDHPHTLELDKVSALNQWLKDYLDTSLNRILLDAAADQHLTEDGFVHLVSCALRNDSDVELHAFAVVDRVFDLVAQRGSANA
jgi:hypothetical protein